MPWTQLVVTNRNKQRINCELRYTPARGERIRIANKFFTVQRVTVRSVEDGMTSPPVELRVEEEDAA